MSYSERRFIIFCHFHMLVTLQLVGILDSLLQWIGNTCKCLFGSWKGSAHRGLYETSHRRPCETSHRRPYETSYRRPYETSHRRPYETSHRRPYDTSHSRLYETSHTRLCETSHRRLYELSHRHILCTCPIDVKVAILKTSRKEHFAWY